MDEPLYGTSFGTEHTKGIDILAVVHVTQCAILRVQPVLQGLESSFSWALIFVHRLRVDEGEVYNQGRVSAFVSLIMVSELLPYSFIFRRSFISIFSHFLRSRLPRLRPQGSTWCLALIFFLWASIFIMIQWTSQARESATSDLPVGKAG